MANHTSHAALPFPIRGARFTIGVPYLDADGDPTDPTTPDTEFSADAAAFTDCAEEVSTITGSNGLGYLTLTGAETDCAILGVAAKVASGPKATIATLYPRDLVVIATGTLSAGSAGGGTLGSILAYDITGCFIKTTGGTGGGGTGGANNQARRIHTYDVTNGQFTLNRNWETAPDNTTTYAILLPEGMTLGALRTLNPTTAGRTLNVDAGNKAPATIAAGDIANNAITAASIAADALTAAKVAADVGTEIATAVWANGTRTLTSLGASLVDEIWEYLTSAVATVGSFGQLFKDNLDAAVSTRLATAGYTTPPTANQNADALLDRAAAVDTFTPRQILRGLAAAAFGDAAGFGTATATYDAADSSKVRITASILGSGNRTITLDLT